MASSYALPASAIHSHHHVHSHSHSASPSRPFSNSSRSLKSEKSNSSLHVHSASESSTNHGHDHHISHLNNAPHAHNHDRIPRIPTPPSSNSFPPYVSYEKPKSDHSHPHSHVVNSYEASRNDVNAIPQSYGQHDQFHSHTHHDHDHDHDHDHSHHIHDHHDHKLAKTLEPHSKFTGLILPMVQWSPLLHTIMSEKDSRRIFYFMSLNFAFMLVQAFYGYATDSLGLLSDSIHMLFDCLALAVGLFASVASKWSPSERFPYGFGKIESLSGFGNGVFLMLISVEIMIEATERLADGRETKRLLELFVVSGMGLAVNLVGMACFGHHHHGHDQGDHSHGHLHSHGDEKPHSHGDGDNHDHDHGHEHSHDHSDEHIHAREAAHGHDSQAPLISEKSDGCHAHDHHGHSHDNDNMHGIFLHVLADTMGSAAVMVSTALIYFTKWSGWDPIASCVIAVLIFLSSIPLIKSTAKKLLLTVPDDVEYNLRTTLSAVSDLRGVANYAVPRFWLGDKNVQAESEGVLGVIHILTTRGSDLDDVRGRTRALLKTHGVDAVIQVEKDGDTSCWCGIASGRSPNPSNGSRF